MSSPDIFLIWTVQSFIGLMRGVIRMEIWYGPLEDRAVVLYGGIKGANGAGIVIGIESMFSWVS